MVEYELEENDYLVSFTAMRTIRAPGELEALVKLLDNIFILNKDIDPVEIDVEVKKIEHFPSGFRR